MAPSIGAVGVEQCNRLGSPGRLCRRGGTEQVWWLSPWLNLVPIGVVDRAKRPSADT